MSNALTLVQELHIESGKLQSEKDRVERLLHTLRSQLEEKEAQVKRWQEEANDWKHKLQSLQQAPVDTAQVTQLTQQLHQVQTESEQRIGALQQQMLQQMQTVEAHKRQSEELKQHIHSSELAKQQLEIELQHLKQRLSTSTQQHQEAMQRAEEELVTIRAELRSRSEAAVVPVDQV